jgi:hypothetical protein
MKMKTLAVTCAIAATLIASGAQAQTKTIYVGMNGGTMEKNYTASIFPDFEKANNVKVVVVPRHLLRHHRQDAGPARQAADARGLPR